MACKLIQPLIQPSQALLLTPRSANSLKSFKVVSFRHLKSKRLSFYGYPSGFRSIFITKVAEPGFELSGEHRDAEVEEEATEEQAVSQIKETLYKELEGINRGIFGVSSSKKLEIERLVKLLEFQNPTQDLASNLDKVGGSWKLLYSTITILGTKRTKLGLRDFITLGDFLQNIDVVEGKAVNVIKFHARGLNLLNGQLTIEASFKITSNKRVNITYEKSTITPDQLMNLFRKNYDLLLGIFNPQGWLEISFVDETLRIGRDDKGNIFILKRAQEI